MTIIVFSGNVIFLCRGKVNFNSTQLQLKWVHSGRYAEKRVLRRVCGNSELVGCWDTYPPLSSPHRGCDRADASGREGAFGLSHPRQSLSKTSLWKASELASEGFRHSQRWLSSLQSKEPALKRGKICPRPHRPARALPTWLLSQGPSWAQPGSRNKGRAQVAGTRYKVTQ